MNVDKFIAIVKTRLGNRQDLLDYQILDELSMVQETLEMSGSLPWFLMLFAQPLVTVAGVPTVALPADFLREHEDLGGLYYYDSAGVFWPLSKDIDPFIRAKQLATGRPRAYSLDATSIHLFGTPDAIYNLRLSYYKKDTVIVDPADAPNLWLTNASRLMLASVCTTMAMQLQMDKMVGVFQAEALGAARDLEVATIAREEVWRRAVMGDTDAGDIR